MQINNNNIVRTRITYNNIGLVGSILFENNARVAYTYGLNGEKLRVAHWAALASAASANGSVSGGILNPSLPRNIKTTEYIGGGEKLRVIYQTAVPNITVAIGSTRELTAAETLYTDSIDYRLGGALTLRNGRIDKYQFEEGYCQAERNSSTTDAFTFCYYDMDHLGNIRQVTEADGSSTGEIIQTNNYYPFGAQFCDGTAVSNVQSRKYNGKEFDRMHGLNTYDYGARQYNPVTARWDRIDRYSEKYYSFSPYAYCGNNPVNAIDHKGDSIIKLIIIDKTNTFSGNNILYIDHTIFPDVKKILDYCVNSNTKIHFNSSFRTNRKQSGLNNKNATTPTKAGNSPHNAGLGIDFNLYKGDTLDNGNKNVNNETPFIKFIKSIGWRWGGNFSSPDRIHIDKRQDDKSFRKIRDENQEQMKGDQNIEPKDEYINRTEELEYE